MLKDIVVQKKTVEVPGQTASFDVQGLSLETITSLLESYSPELTAIFNGEADPTTLVTKSPLFVASLVALAADEPDAIDTVRKLPFGVQLIALEAVWDLTLPDPDSLGKLVDRVIELVVPRSQEKKALKSSPKTSKPQSETSGNVTSL